MNTNIPTHISKEIKEISEKISKEFKPEKIIIFGSHAWGNPGIDSDVDLLVIKETERSTREVAREIDASLWGRTIPLDIIVYKPDSIKKGLKIGDFFIRNIIEKGIVVYERR